MRLGRVLFMAAMIAAAPALAAPQYSADRQIEVDQAWARIAPNETDTVSVFFQIYNASDKPDVLTGAISPDAKNIAIRRGHWKGLDFFNNTTKNVPIRARKTLVFRPGEYEVTLNKFNMQVGVGATIPVTLSFRDAGDVTFSAQITNQLLGNRPEKK